MHPLKMQSFLIADHAFAQPATKSHITASFPNPMQDFSQFHSWPSRRLINDISNNYSIVRCGLFVNIMPS